MIYIAPKSRGESGRINCCNHMAAITRQWWRRLVNAYEVKAGMVRLQSNIGFRALQRRASYTGALIQIYLTSGYLLTIILTKAAETKITKLGTGV